MPFSDAPPPAAPAATGSGISFGLSVGKRRSSCRLTIRKAAQEKIFGADLTGKRAHVKVGRGADEGRLLIQIARDGEFEFRPSMHGSVMLTLGTWDLLPKDKRPAAECSLHSVNGSSVVLQLPSWTKPSGVGGRIAAEHSLKR